MLIVPNGKSMIEFKLKLAEKIIKVSALFETTKEYCKDFFANCDKEHDFEVVMTEKMISDERAIHVAENGEDAKAYLTDDYVETLALYRAIVEKLVEYNVVMFHGSAIAVDGVAYIFAALSGTGKSTHTRLWREHFGDRAVMVNDDKPLLTVTDDGITVHGTPWNGKHNLGSNISVPVKAICILERAENNHIERISPKAAYPTFFQQTYRSKNPSKLLKILALIDKTTKVTGVYRLGCNMNPDAATVSYNGMSKKEI